VPRVQCTESEPDKRLLSYSRVAIGCLVRVAAMNKDARDCLKRAAECARLADAESDPALKAYLIRLASSWMQAATDADECDFDAQLRDRPWRQFGRG
jgi:hypothetical protein